jgi:hypothetical protein
MKNFKLIVFIGALFFSGSSFAQCVPDASITQSGVYPDSLPHAYVGVPYSTDIQFRVPVDTTYMGLPAIITSIDVTNVTGLPVGFTYSCTPSGCSFPGGSNGCMLLQSANPIAAGTYPIIVEMTVYGTIFGSPQSIPATNDNYSIVIDNSVGVGSFAPVVFTVGQNLPNPSKGITEIPVTMPLSGAVEVKITDLIGKVVFNSRVLVQKGSTTIPINTNSMRKGVYVYSVSNGVNTISKRMIIAD